MFDVVIIGAGVVGCAIARELSRYKLRIALVEREPDVAMGASKANSAIVHGGYAESHAKLKGRLCYQGRRQFARLDQELHFGFKPIGSMVLAFEDNQRPHLEAMRENGRRNGLLDLSILNHDQVLEREPNVSDEVCWALYCEGAGVCSPFELTVALAENALTNGAELFLNSEVTALEQQDGLWRVRTAAGETLESRFVVNASGLAAAYISAMAGVGGFEIRPRSGEFILLGRDTGTLVNSVLFQMPTKMGKGILVTPTIYGNLLVGPDAIDEERNDRDTHVERLAYIWRVAEQTTDKLDINGFLRSFAGVRAVADTDDFIIGATEAPGFINVAGIQSPGMTSSPAIAQMVRDILREQGLALEEDPAFVPNRKPTYTEHEFLPREQAEQLLALPEGDERRMVCRDEQVYETVLRDAMARGIPLTTPDAVKRRTRAGMGYCQGAFCRPRVVSLLEQQANGAAIDPRTDPERAGLARVDRKTMLKYMKNQERG